MIRVPECARVSRCLCVISDVMPGRASAPDVVSRIILFTVFTVCPSHSSGVFLPVCLVCVPAPPGVFEPVPAPGWQLNVNVNVNGTGSGTVPVPDRYSCRPRETRRPSLPVGRGRIG